MEPDRNDLLRELRELHSRLSTVEAVLERLGQRLLSAESHEWSELRRELSRFQTEHAALMKRYLDGTERLKALDSRA